MKQQVKGKEIDRRVFVLLIFTMSDFFSRMKKQMMKMLKMTGERSRILRSDLRITVRTTLGLWFFSLLYLMIA